MAEIKTGSMKSFEFDATERAWIKQSLMNQSKMLLRARSKEIVGGEIWTLRGREIESLNALAVRF